MPTMPPHIPRSKPYALPLTEGLIALAELGCTLLLTWVAYLMFTSFSQLF
jgi:hypothetical protein